MNPVDHIESAVDEHDRIRLVGFSFIRPGEPDAYPPTPVREDDIDMFLSVRRTDPCIRPDDGVFVFPGIQIALDTGGEFLAIPLT